MNAVSSLRAERLVHARSVARVHLGQADLLALWQQFKARGCQKAREQLIEAHQYLVAVTAGKLYGKLAGLVEKGDLLGEGYVGLIRAVDNYDPARGVQFPTYAIALIRGAILESLRENDWVPRSVRTRAKAIQKAEETFETRCGRAPSDAELEAQLGWTPAKLLEERACAARTQQVSLSQPVQDEGGTTVRLEDVLIAEGAAPWQEAYNAQRTERLQQAIDTLPERERRTMRLYYDAGKTFKEIGRTLCISESRVYQLHAQAAARLYLRLGEEWDERNSPRWRAEA